MTTSEAVAIYRAEKAAAQSRGADISTAKPIPGKSHSRHRVMDRYSGVTLFRTDAFLVIRPRTGS